MRIGVLGTGIVGQTIGGKLVQLGHDVKLGSRSAENPKADNWTKQAGSRATHGTFADSAAFGEIVSNCTAGTVSLDALRLASADNLSGKLLIDVANPDLTRYYAFSLAYSGGQFNLAADLRGDFGVPGKSLALAFNAGGEYIFSNAFPVRLGYSLDKITNRQDLSAGAGFIVDNMGVDVAYRHELGGIHGHMVALTLRFTTQPDR